MFVKIKAAAALGLAASLLLVATAGAASPPAVTVSVRIATVTEDSLGVLWRLDLAEGWHVYGPFRNDTGFAPQVALELPEGWSAGPLRWPVPERYVTAGEILDHVYHGPLLLPQTLRRPPGSGPADLRARVSWLACAEICVPGDTTLVVPVPTSGARDGADALTTALAAVPGPLPSEAASVSATAEAVTIRAPGAAAVTAIPGPTGPFFVDLIADGHAAGPELRLRLRAAAEPAAAWSVLLVIDHEGAGATAGYLSIPSPEHPSKEVRP
jgi:DsbC/DsbD-like thiol-disulfide interchange protein